MADLDDGFLVLPSGLGTYDELFEAITWSHLTGSPKNVRILDVEGFCAPLRQLLEQLEPARVRLRWRLKVPQPGQL